MENEKRTRCLYVKPIKDSNQIATIDVQEALCHTFVSIQGWRVCQESYASLFWDDQITPNLIEQLNDICCNAAMPEFDVLLVATRKFLDIPEEYVTQAINWLRENNVETWIVCEGKLS